MSCSPPISASISRNPSRSQSPKSKRKKQTEGEEQEQEEKELKEKEKEKEINRNELTLKLQSISTRLAEIQLEKRKLSPLYHPSKKTTREKKSYKREYHHPKLEFVMAEAAYSPYLTPPTASYGHKTLHYPEKMKEIRFQGRDPIPEEGFPVDIEFARKRFIKDIIKFKPRFEVRILYYLFWIYSRLIYLTYFLLFLL